MSSVATRTFTDRLIAAARLDSSVYEEVEADTSATPQAAGAVAIVAMASAVGHVGHGVGGMISGIIAATVGWLLWAGITYLIGDKLLGGTATWGELLRTLGFAQAPGILFILAAAPVVGWVIAAVVSVWLLLAGIIAIRQACDFGTGRAILTAVLALIPYHALRLWLM